MKASELIEKLQALVEEHGDLPACIIDMHSLVDFDKIGVFKEDEWTNKPAMFLLGYSND
jgi:hypothetical protein